MSSPDCKHTLWAAMSPKPIWNHNILTALAGKALIITAVNPLYRDATPSSLMSSLSTSLKPFGYFPSGAERDAQCISPDVWQWQRLKDVPYVTAQDFQQVHTAIANKQDSSVKAQWTEVRCSPSPKNLHHQVIASREERRTTFVRVGSLSCYLHCWSQLSQELHLGDRNVRYKNWWNWLIRKWSYHMSQTRTATDFKWKAQDVLMLMLHGFAEVFFKSSSTQKTISSFWHCPGKYCLCQSSEEVIHRSAQLNRTTMNPHHPHSSTRDWLSGTRLKLWCVSLLALVWYKQPQQPLLREIEIKFPALIIMICDSRKMVTVQWRAESTETMGSLNKNIHWQNCQTLLKHKAWGHLHCN